MRLGCFELCWIGFQTMMGYDKNPEKIIYPQSIGHQFVYSEEYKNEGYDGRMDPIRAISHLVLPQDYEYN